MIPRITQMGHGFAGAGLYYLNDKRENQHGVHNAGCDDGPVTPDQDGSYKDLKRQKKKNGETEPLNMDHQPSFAAQVAKKEADLSRKLTEAERKTVRDESPAVASPTKIHQKTSPTFGGRNTKERIA